MKAYKGFDKDLKCRGFQYEIGKEYEEKEAEACEKGFHACENPLEVFRYYPPCDGNRYCEVEQDGELSKHGGDSKVASTKIKSASNLDSRDLYKLVFHLFSIRSTGKPTRQLIRASSQQP